MTDEEKANEYFKNLDDCRTKELMIDAYLDGLAEGRKEKCLEQNKDGTIRPCELLKENEELKERLQIESQSLHEQCEIVSKQVDQIEKMKRCFNCSKWFSNTELCVSNERGTNICDKWELAE